MLVQSSNVVACTLVQPISKKQKNYVEENQNLLAKMRVLSYWNSWNSVKPHRGIEEVLTPSKRVLTHSIPWQYPYWVPNTLSIPLFGVSRYSKNSNIYQGIHVYIYIYLDPWGAQSSITTFHNMLRMLVVPRSQAGEVR